MLTISDLYDLHNLCVESIAFWQTAPHFITSDMRERNIDKYKKLIDKLAEERKKL